MVIGGKEFKTKEKTYLMGILNFTPDSFSDGGKYSGLDRALFRVEEMVKEGADILDLGGESTRPGATPVEVSEELNRVIPVIEAVKKNFDIPLSLDTYKAVVAEEGIKAGVDLINDIWGLQQGEDMARIIAKYQIPCCLMHNRKQGEYQNFIEDIMSDFSSIIHTAIKAGIRKENIILDPGIGFAKDTKQNLVLLSRLKELKVLGFPLLLGVSRKSVVGNILKLPVEERLNGTLALNILGYMEGCAFLRVHDVRPHKEALTMLEAVRGR
ncbi:MAG: dihydropteroate synthase [Lachnospiraceae bacterium]|nr:dihydropteroate synthase [Lachnospiraceae bacterium]